LSEKTLSEKTLSEKTLSEKTLSEKTLSNTALSDYQKATLQTMGIPMYERREGISLFDSLSQPSEPLADSAASQNRNNANLALDAEQGTQHAVDESVIDRLAHSEQNNEQKRPELVDESNDFIKQVLSVFAVNNTAELALIWQVHDSETISLKDNILITPHAEALTAAASKKQLWKTLGSHFKAQEWS
jgi:hypothetical protein